MIVLFLTGKGVMYTLMSILQDLGFKVHCLCYVLSSYYSSKMGKFKKYYIT